MGQESPEIVTSLIRIMVLDTAGARNIKQEFGGLVYQNISVPRFECPNLLAPIFGRYAPRKRHLGIIEVEASVPWYYALSSLIIASLQFQHLIMGNDGSPQACP